MNATETLQHTIQQAGGSCYQVGGAVRDALLGLPNKDADFLVTGLSADQLKTILPGKVGLVGLSFEVFKVTLQGETLDVALPRDHQDVMHDLRHRDFTINALAIDRDGNTIDPTGGLQDLQNRLIRVIDPERFHKDPLRMLRAVRFVAKLGFDLEEGTFRAIQQQVHLLDQVAPERIQEELLRLLACPDADQVLKALRTARDCGVLTQILPEFAPCIGFDQQNPHHFLTVDEHIFASVHHAVKQGHGLRTRLALLLHDIAKPGCFSKGADGVGHFYEHEFVGKRQARLILTRLKCPLHLTETVALMVKNHMRPPSHTSLRTLRRYMNDLGEAWEDGLNMREADLVAHVLPAGFDPVAWAARLRERARDMQQVATFDDRQLALSGKAIMEHFQVQGSEIGRLKKLATQAIIEGELENEPDAILHYLQHQEL